MDPKKIAARQAVSLVLPGMLVGLGTGTTASWAIKLLGEMVAKGLAIRAIASSVSSELLAKQSGIPLVDADNQQRPDITIDGADEVDPQGNLIKGGGGALLREKILAWNTQNFVVIVDESKHVPLLGKHPVPVEVLPFALHLTLNNLASLGCQTIIRKSGDKIFMTDNGHHIIDCTWPSIADASDLDEKIKKIPGVMETGLFPYQMVDRIVTGYGDGRVREMLLNR